MWPHGSIQYRTILIPVHNTTTLEPGIGSIDTRYLVSPSTVNWGSKYRWDFSLSGGEFVNRNNKVVMPYSDRYAGEGQWLECDFTSSHHSAAKA